MGADPQGNGAPGASQGTGAPEATQQQASGVTLDDVNRAITARFRDFDKKIETRLGEQFTSFESKILEAVQSSSKQAEGEKTDGKSNATAIEDHPAFKSLQKQLSEIKNREAKVAQEREEERAKSRDLKLRQQLTEKLGELGIDGARAKHAIHHLVDGERRVSIDTDELITFRDANGEALDLQMGLKTWATSEDAKFYLPPRGVAGSGDAGRINTTGAARNGVQDPKALLTQLVGQRYFGG